MAFHVIVEGYGEVKAVPNLLNRLALDLGLQAVWAPPKRILVARRQDAEKVADLVPPDAQGVLVLRDCEDECPLSVVPELIDWFQALALPYPVACAMFYREYETMFLPCLEQMAGTPLSAGRAGIVPGASFSGNPESKRDAKGVVSSALPANRSYKETIDQLELTRLLDFATLRSSALPSFGTLERAVVFLTAPHAVAGKVFPRDR